MKKVIKYAAISLVVIVIIYLIDTKGGKTKGGGLIPPAKTETVQKPVDTLIKTPPVPIQHWQYDSAIDKMTGKQKYFATVVSTNVLNFDFPYDGGSTGTILLRNQNKKTDVLLTISKGQFNVSVIDGSAVKVRFDDDPAQVYFVTAPSDGSSNILFISPSSKFVKELAKSSAVKVEVEFYQSGLKVLEFNTAGLNWKF